MPWKSTARSKVVGMQWPIRKVFALAQMANVVVGVETAVTNAVAHEPNLKIVLLSHSTNENLTRDWVETVAMEPRVIPCYPCHRIHHDATHCNFDGKFAICQAAVSADEVMKAWREWRAQRKEVA